MEGYLSEYLPIAIFMVLAIGLSIAFVVGAVVVGSQKPDIEKLTAYECGFDAFDDSRKPFDVRFYLVVGALEVTHVLLYLLLGRIFLFS